MSDLQQNSRISLTHFWADIFTEINRKYTINGLKNKNDLFNKINGFTIFLIAPYMLVVKRIYWLTLKEYRSYAVNGLSQGHFEDLALKKC